jgi:DNA polymerase IV
LKIKYADFQLITRSLPLPRAIEERAALERVSIDLLRVQFPVTKGIRPLGISIAALGRTDTAGTEQLPLGI